MEGSITFDDLQELKIDNYKHDDDVEILIDDPSDSSEGKSNKGDSDSVVIERDGEDWTDETEEILETWVEKLDHYDKEYSEYLFRLKRKNNYFSIVLALFTSSTTFLSYLNLVSSNYLYPSAIAATGSTLITLWKTTITPDNLIETLSEYLTKIRSVSIQVKTELSLERSNRKNGKQFMIYVVQNCNELIGRRPFIKIKEFSS